VYISMSHAGTEDKFIKTLFPLNMHNLKVLDVGCGYGETGLYIRTRTYKRGWCQLEGIEIFPEYYDLQMRMGIYNDLYLGDASNMSHIQDNNYDLSIAQQVIEHLDKEHGKKLLREMERVTKQRVIICTPHGYTESGPLDDNEHNNHLSGWYPYDFIPLGYSTKIVAKNVNSRLLQMFAKTVFTLQGKTWDNEVLVAWKDLEKS